MAKKDFYGKTVAQVREDNKIRAMIKKVKPGDPAYEAIQKRGKDLGLIGSNKSLSAVRGQGGQATKLGAKLRDKNVKPGPGPAKTARRGGWSSKG